MQSSAFQTQLIEEAARHEAQIQMFREIVLEDEEATFERKRQLHAAIGELQVHLH